MNILITGDRGYIGSSLTRELQKNFKVTSVNRSNVDLTNRDLVRSFFKDKFFDVVIHAAIEGGHRLQKDTEAITHNNLLMFSNILENENHFKRLINFSSGYEVHTDTPYGLSKSIISRLVDGMVGGYNLRLFGVFDENEINTRFIKSNLLRYINGKDMVIHKDKFMDFFYLEDLVETVRYYITSDKDKLLKNIDCVYTDKYKLSDIAGIINNLSDTRVQCIIENEELDNPYTGNANNINKLSIKQTDISEGIFNTYKKLL